MPGAGPPLSADSHSHRSRQLSGSSGWAVLAIRSPLPSRCPVSPWLGTAAGDAGCLLGWASAWLPRSPGCGPIPVAWITPSSHKSWAGSATCPLPAAACSPAPAWAACSVPAALAKFKRPRVLLRSSRSLPPRQHSAQKPSCCTPRPGQWSLPWARRRGPLGVSTSSLQHRPLSA